MTASVITGRRPRRTPHACLLRHAWWFIAAAAVFLRPSDHTCNIFADASSIRRPGTSSRMTNNNNNNSGTSKTTPLPAHCRPNRFVSASPLAVAAVCREGVVMAALHTSPALEPLLVHVDDVALVPGEEQRDTTSEDGRDGEDSEEDIDATLGTRSKQKRVVVKDLPRSYRGPFRVASIDAYGTSLLSAGWRSDCHSLSAKCRSLAAEEAASYMHGDLGSVSTVAAPPKEDYAAGLASDASLWLAKCAMSGGIRTKNCVGLLAAATSCCTEADDDNVIAAGRLYLVDAAGIHRARALAIGHGSDCINRRLLGVDFSNLGRDEAVRKLMDVILQNEEEKNDEDGNDDDDDDDTNAGTQDDIDLEGDHVNVNKWKLPKGSRVELAFVDAKQMTRINRRI